MSSLRRILERTWEENRLFSVLLELTYSCNLSCFFCYNDLGKAGVPLATEQLLELLSDLAELEVMNLTLSGGEPLAHPDFFLLGARARELGFVVRVKSNGHALGRRMARRLREEVDPFIVELSLHGASAGSHERQTGIPGSFERLLANIAGLRNEGLRLRLNSTLTRWNEAEVEAMFALADDLGLPLFFDPEVSPRDDGDPSPLDVSASREGLRRLFACEERRRRGAEGDAPPALPAPPAGKHCGAGSSGLAIDPYGNVYPCVQWRRSAGNLHERSIREIWQGSSTLREVRALGSRIARAVAEVGPDAYRMSFCPGAAERQSGSPLAIYPAARERLALLRGEAPGRDGPPRRRPLLPVLP